MGLSVRMFCSRRDFAEGTFIWLLQQFDKYSGIISLMSIFWECLAFEIKRDHGFTMLKASNIQFKTGTYASRATYCVGSKSQD